MQIQGNSEKLDRLNNFKQFHLFDHLLKSHFFEYHWFLMLQIMFYRKIDFIIKVNFVILLDDHWKFKIVVFKADCHYVTTCRWNRRLSMYDASTLFSRLKTNASRRLILYIRTRMLEYLKLRSWTYQNELQLVLKKEWSVKINRFTISKVIKEKSFDRKKWQFYSNKQSHQLRVAWQANMLNFTTKQLIVIDEIFFKAQTSWRCMTYEFIDEIIRYFENLRRNNTFSVLSIYIIENYLFCTIIRQNYFDNEIFYNWIVNDFLSHCNVYFASRSVIVLNNVNIHIKFRIREIIEIKECLIRYFSFYSSDLNSIELMFNVLKIWMRRHWRELRTQFQDDFVDFLKYAVNFSDCDIHAREHFRYSNRNYDDYRFESDYEIFQREFEIWFLQTKKKK